MRDSHYRDPDYKLIHAHDLALVRLFVDYLSGSKTFPNGGVVLAATTTGNSPLAPELDFAIIRTLAMQAGHKVPVKDPWAVMNEGVLKSLDNVPVMKLGGLSKQEAKGLIEYYAKSGVLRQKVDDRTVSERWTVAGGGIIGEIERGVFSSRM
jgi:small subunit ribosomal protein S29